MAWDLEFEINFNVKRIFTRPAPPQPQYRAMTLCIGGNWSALEKRKAHVLFFFLRPASLLFFLITSAPPLLPLVRARRLSSAVSLHEAGRRSRAHLRTIGAMPEHIAGTTEPKPLHGGHEPAPVALLRRCYLRPSLRRHISIHADFHVASSSPLATS